MTVPRPRLRGACSTAPRPRPSAAAASPPGGPLHCLGGAKRLFPLPDRGFLGEPNAIQLPPKEHGRHKEWKNHASGLSLCEQRRRARQKMEGSPVDSEILKFGGYEPCFGVGGQSSLRGGNPSFGIEQCQKAARASATTATNRRSKPSLEKSHIRRGCTTRNGSFSEKKKKSL